MSSCNLEFNSSLSFPKLQLKLNNKFPLGMTVKSIMNKLHKYKYCNKMKTSRTKDYGFNYGVVLLISSLKWNFIQSMNKSTRKIEIKEERTLEKHIPHLFPLWKSMISSLKSILQTKESLPYLQNCVEFKKSRISSLNLAPFGMKDLKP